MAVAVSLAMLISLIALNWDVRGKLAELATSNHDNLQWSLSQIEVEFLQLNRALQAASAGRVGLGQVQRRFDVFYSRIATLRQSRNYEELRVDPAFSAHLEAMTGFLDEAVPLVDGSPDALRDALPDLIVATNALADDARTMALFGISHFAERTDRQRQGIYDTLLTAGGLAVVAFLLFGATLVALLLLYDRARAESEKRAITANRLAAIFDTSLDAVVVVNDRGHLLEFNPAAEAIFGYRRSEVLGQDMARVIVPPGLRKAHKAGMERYLSSGVPKLLGTGRLELEAMRRDGTTFPVEMSLSVAEARGKKVFISFIRDISGRRGAEAALLKARDDALAGEKAKVDLLAVMSHEIRTPLNGVLGTLDLLRDTDLTAEQRDYLRMMDVSGQQLLHHVNDVLDVTRHDAGATRLQREPFDLSAMARDLIASFKAPAAANGNEIRFVGAEGADWVLSDIDRLRQVLTNVIGNAIKFTRNGTVELHLEREEDTVILHIRDTGVGIAEQDLERIFEDFITLNTDYDRPAAGTGLGLGIVRRIVEALGGTISVASVVGEGTQVTLRLDLPPIDAPERDQPYRADDTGQASRSLEVLVVEDNSINQTVICRMLERAGHTVDVARDGDEGIALASQFAYDVILMDISMPRVSGIDATRAIRAAEGPSQHAPIIATTAHAQPSDRRRFAEAGLNGTLTKPMTQADLAAVLAPIIDGEEIGASPPAPGENDSIVEMVPFDLNIELIDAATFGALVHALGSEAIGEILKTFRAQGDALMASLADAPEKDAYHTLASDAHKLAGSAGVLGAKPLTEELNRIEVMIRTQQFELLPERIAALPALWRATLDYLED